MTLEESNDKVVSESLNSEVEFAANSESSLIFDTDESLPPVCFDHLEDPDN